METKTKHRILGTIILAVVAYAGAAGLVNANHGERILTASEYKEQKGYCSKNGMEFVASTNSDKEVVSIKCLTASGTIVRSF